MGLTRAQATALGLGHLYPTRTDGEILSRFGIEPVVPSPSKDPGDGMNKLERSFAEALNEGVIKLPCHRWEREPVKLRLAGRTWYTPDFGVFFVDGGLTLIEVKGFMRDDAAVKIKVAAVTYPEWDFYLVRRAGRHMWSVREVGRNGIGTHEIVVPWIGGGT